MPINETMKMMQHLNNAEKRTVKAFRVLTHAFYCVYLYDRDAANLLLNYRWKALNELPKLEPAWSIALNIKDTQWRKWCKDAKAAGLHS